MTSTYEIPLLLEEDHSMVARILLRVSISTLRSLVASHRSTWIMDETYKVRLTSWNSRSSQCMVVTLTKISINVLCCQVLYSEFSGLAFNS
jgi:hypothetical protein